MSTIVLRTTKGSALTNTEVDNNFSNLNTDKLQLGGTYSSGTANGVTYLNGSKALTSGSALTFDGTNFFGGTNIYASGRLYAQRSSGSLNLAIAGYTDGSAGAILSGNKGDIVAFGNAGGDGVIFANANTEQMRLTSTGLGIGTSSLEGMKLVAKGATGYPATSGTTQTGVFRISGGTGLYNVLDMGVNESTDTAWMQATRANSLGTYDKLVINPYGGNVGIGTSSPGARLTTRAAANSYTAGALQIESLSGTYKSYITNVGGLMLFSNSSTVDQLVLDSSGNLGLGVAPSAWYTTFKAFQFGGNGSSLFGRSENNMAAIGSNVYVNAAGSNTYINTNTASYFQQLNGAFQWYTAPSGTAGNAISFTQAMTLTAAGRLLIGKTTDAVNNTTGTEISSGNMTLSTTTASPVLDLRASNPSVAADIGGVISFSSVYLNSNSDTTNIAYIKGLRENATNNAWSSYLSFWTTNGTTLAERMRITSAGNVGIGATTVGGMGPQTGLTVVGGATVSSGDPGILTLGAHLNARSVGDPIGKIDFYSNDASGGASGVQASIRGITEGSLGESAGLAFHTGTSSSLPERMRIDSSGNITSTTSEAYLYFTSNYSVGSNTRAAIRTVGTGGGSGYGGDLRFSTRKPDNNWNNDAVVIDSSGNVGIGTNGESMRLAMKGTIADSTYPLIKGIVGAPYTGGWNTLAPETTIGGYQLFTYRSDVGEVNKSSAIEVYLANNTFGAGITGMRFITGGYNATNGTEAMRINELRNVGIGTSSPTQKLEVSGGAAQFNNGGIDGTLGDAILFGNSTYPTVQKNRIRSSIGAGTAGTNLLVFEASTETAGINSTNQLVLAGTGRIGFQNDAMTLTATGNLLVGKTTPSLTTAGFSFVKSGGTTYAEFTHTNTGDTSANIYLSRSNTGSGLLFYRVDSTSVVGSVVIGTSSTSYNTSSDYRLKEDWVAVADASTRVNALKPVNFAWKVDGKRVDGFLAHEVAEVVPEAVTGTKDAVDAEGNPEYQGIDQSKLVPLLTAALQEALAKIESLTARVSALEGN